MNTNSLPVMRRMQANQQLKERAELSTMERDARYALAGKHKQETSLLCLENGSVHERVALAARQARERRALTDRIHETRLAMHARHHQEDVILNQDWTGNLRHLVNLPL